MSNATRTGERIILGTLALIVTVLIVALMTIPLIFLLDDALAGYPHDGFEHLWSFWWTYRAIVKEGASPAQAYLINYPVGLVNPHFTVTPYARWVALPFMGWMDPVLFYNGHLYLSFILTLASTYLLCYHVTQKSLAAVIGALVYAFFPNKTKHILGGHFLQAIVYWFPLYALFLWRLTRQPRRRAGVLLGVFALLSLLVDLTHIGYFVIPFTLLFLGWDLFHRRKEVEWRAIMGPAVIAALIVCLGVAPLFIPFARDAFFGELDYYRQGGFVRYSADLLGFFVPPPEHWASRAWPALESLSTRLASEGWNENVFYVGWAALVLAIIGLWEHDWGKRSVWLVVVLGAAILSLGPQLKFAGHLLPIPLPYAWLRQLPFYEWARTPGRINETVMLGIAVLTAWGAAKLLSRVRTGRARLLVTVLLATIVLGDYAIVVPWPMADTSVPEFYPQLATQAGDGAVLDLPLWEFRTGQYQLYYQTVHGRPIVGGHFFRRMPEAEEVMHEIEALSVPDLAPGPDAPLQLKDYGVEYVVLHRRFMSPDDLAEHNWFLARSLGRPVYQDKIIIAFRVTGAGS